MGLMLKNRLNLCSLCKMSDLILCSVCRDICDDHCILCEVSVDSYLNSLPNNKT